MQRKRSSFIELSVAVVVMAGLLFVGLNVFENVKVKNRDNQRVADIKELQKGLELYRSTTDKYPISPTETTIDGTDAMSRALLGEALFRVIPTDPLHPEFTYRYRSDSAGNDYVLFFCQEAAENGTYAEGCRNVVRP